MQSIPNNLIVVNALPPNDTHPKEDWQSFGPTNIELNSLKVPNLRKLLTTSQIKWSEKFIGVISKNKRELIYKSFLQIL